MTIPERPDGGPEGGALFDLAQDWLAQDPDPETRAELEALIEAAAGAEGTGQEEALAATAELRDRFGGLLEFGTAGIRAELGAGPMRMNRVVVARAAAGLAAFLDGRPPGEGAARVEGRPSTLRPAQGGARPSVVIGYDGRINSEVFARDAAEVMAGAGVRVELLSRALPTPVLAFCVRHLGVDAGVMITASHNPRRDNGVKVYLGGEDGGSQIVPPVDAEIAAAIAAVGPVPALPRSTSYQLLSDAPVEAYVAATAQVARIDSALATAQRGQPHREGASAPSERESEGLRIAYTAMHGVGLEVARRVFAAAGLPELLAVPEQAEPDGDFPTVAFPNPEEPGALDLAAAFATSNGCDLIVANDPDADRLAIAVPDPADPAGWRRLTGNDVGLLLGWDAAIRARSEAAERADGQRPRLASSLVSSPGLAAIAAHHGLEHAETLTGFKWISRVPGLIYGYEEALGYLVNPDTVRDKDGISAAARFVALAESWRSAGRTVDDALDEIAGAIGGYASGQVSIRVDDLAEISRLTDGLRAAPPASIAGREVVRTTDYRAERDADILRYDLVDGSRVIVRPSGTEPKLKAYLDSRTEVGSARQRRTNAAAIVVELAQAVRDLLRR